MVSKDSDPAPEQRHLGSTGIGLACCAVSCFGVQPHFKTGILVGILTMLAYKLVQGKPGFYVKCIQRALLAWSSLIIVFRLLTCQASPVFLQGFPDKCEHEIGCARIAFNHSRQADEFPPFVVAASRAHVKETLHAWLVHTPNSKVLFEADDYIYATRLNKFMGVPEDVAFKLSCTPSGRTAVEAHAELRLGQGTINVNKDTLPQAWTYLMRNSLPPGTCS